MGQVGEGVLGTMNLQTTEEAGADRTDTPYRFERSAPTGGRRVT
jgi:hypothetical protein